jgi:hypothetical protein
MLPLLLWKIGLVGTGIRPLTMATLLFREADLIGVFKHDSYYPTPTPFSAAGQIQDVVQPEITESVT